MINSLKLFDPLHQKVRIGNRHDGGYVIALQSISKSSGLFSYGVGNDISFEKEYIDVTGNNAFCFDHTIENFEVPSEYPTLQYNKEGLAGIATDSCNNFLEHYKERGINGRVLFKADVEGAEYEYILNTDIGKMNSITTGVVFEFHTLQDPTNQSKFFECVKKLNEYYLLCHVHGNNYANNFTYSEIVEGTNFYKQYSIPEVIELSFVNKDLVKYEKLDTKTYPCSFLDRGNDLSKPDCDLRFLNSL